MVWIAAFVVFVMMLYITANVIGRYLFDAPLRGTAEVGVTGMVLVVFLPLAYVQARKQHMVLDVLTPRSARGKAIADALIHLLGFGLLAILSWQTWLWGWNALVTQELMAGSIEIIVWPFKLLVALAWSLMCIQFAIDIGRIISQLLRKSA